MSRSPWKQSSLMQYSWKQASLKRPSAKYSTLQKAASDINPEAASFAWKRSHLIGDLNDSLLYKDVSLNGWVSAIRNVSKNLFFLILRDHTGNLQLTLTRTHIADKVFFAMQKAVADREITTESVISVSGSLQPRPHTMYNDSMTTGRLELFVTDFQVLNPIRVEKLPFTLDAKHLPAEETRLTHRYLDLRRPEMQQTLRLRAQINSTLRQYFETNGFVEVETPILFKSTPEGAREFLVSRNGGQLHYALPQSPQQFKQLLMIGGLDRYYQIARCFRDEGLRADRQPEFTQLDMEMAFVEQEDVMKMMEGAVRVLWTKFKDSATSLTEAIEPLPRITYDQAMSSYGSDKPDIRFPGKIAFCIPEDSCNSRNVIEGLLLKGRGRLSLNSSDSFEFCLPIDGIKTKPVLKAFNSTAGTNWIWHGNDLNRCEQVSKEIKEQIGSRLHDLGLNMGPRDTLLLANRNLDANVGCTALGRARLAALEVLKEDFDKLESDSATNPFKDTHKFLWIHSFPLLTPAGEASLGENSLRRHDSMHHPFTAPEPKSSETLFTTSNPLQLRAQHYDLVLNGQEIGGGSIRIHDAHIQERLMRELLGLSDRQISHFEHLLRALSMGAPPHGGMAFGLDRLVAILAGKKSIREVIAFPKTLCGNDLCFGSSS